MQIIGEEFLEEVGLGSLSSSKKQELLQSYQDELEERIGNVLIDNMNDDQLQQFTDTTKTKDPDQVALWLKSNLPDYEKVLESEINKLKDEIKASVSQILVESKS